MSDDLIRREAAKWLFLKMCIKGEWSPHDVHFSTLDVVDNLDAVPAVEPERKKGEWTNNGGCQFCGFRPWFENDIHTLSFCPNCGADMRGER